MLHVIITPVLLCNIMSVRLEKELENNMCAIMIATQKFIFQ